MSEQSELAKVLARAHKFDVYDAVIMAEKVLEFLKGPRQNKWKLICVRGDLAKQEFAPMKKTDFASILVIFAAGMWVGYVDPDTGEENVIRL